MKKYIATSIVSLLPGVALAQGNQIQVTDLSSLLQGIVTILNLIFPVLVSIAVFFIVVGIFRFVLNAGDEEARKSGRSFILWGVVGVFLMLSVWGLINIVLNTFGFAKPNITNVTFGT